MKLLITAGALILSTMAAQAAPAPGACPKPGTVLTNSHGASATALEADGLWCAMTSTASGKFRMYSLLLREDSQRSPSDDAKAAIDKLWPLAVGKSSQYTFVRDSNKWSEAYKVLRQEPIKTQAGTFNAFVVTQQEEGYTGMGGGNQFRGTSTYYIAPEVGYLVKFEFHIDSGNPHNAPTPWDIVSVTPPK